MSKADRSDWLSENWRFRALTFKYGECRVHVRDCRNEPVPGVKCTGGGYDMTGTCLGKFIEREFGEHLLRLDASKYYGVSHYNTKTRRYQRKPSKHTITYIDGACGMNSMQTILKRIGFKMRYIAESKNSTTYTIEVA